jgi:hypothetical protein
MKTPIFWDLTPRTRWNSTDVSEEYVAFIFRLEEESRAQFAVCFHATNLIGLFLFDPEDGGDILVWSKAWLSMEYVALYIPEDRTLHTHRRENHIFYTVVCDCS